MIFFQFPGVRNIACVFTGRELDLALDSPHAETARYALMRDFAIFGLAALAETRQAHGTEILRDPAPGLANQAADGLMTAKPGLGLMIKTADCQPVLIASNTGEQIMALHVGWRGNRLGFIASAVKDFCQSYALEPNQLLAVRGPSLGNAEFVNFAEEWGDDFAAWHDPATHSMNLWQLTSYQLQAAGIPGNQIYGIDICTRANAAAYFSYRACRDAGRQAGIIWRIP